MFQIGVLSRRSAFVDSKHTIPGAREVSGAVDLPPLAKGSEPEGAGNALAGGVVPRCAVERHPAFDQARPGERHRRSEPLTSELRFGTNSRFNLITLT